MVWYSLVYSLVWYGLVWFGLVWFGKGCMFWNVLVVSKKFYGGGGGIFAITESTQVQTS